MDALLECPVGYHRDIPSRRQFWSAPHGRGASLNWRLRTRVAVADPRRRNAAAAAARCQTRTAAVSIAERQYEVARQRLAPRARVAQASNFLVATKRTHLCHKRQRPPAWCSCCQLHLVKRDKSISRGAMVAKLSIDSIRIPAQCV